jgi:hypothetical protein
MSAEFARILTGLMANRQLGPQAVAYASGRAVSTIYRLVAGATAPSVQLVQDIAPVLQLSVADLLVIAGLSMEPVPDRSGAYEATEEIGSLVAAASWLSRGQVEQVTAHARQLKAERDEQHALGRVGDDAQPGAALSDVE